MAACSSSPTCGGVPEAHIVNVSSVFGLQGMPENSIYPPASSPCAASAAVGGARRTGIGVTCVHPGGVKTNIVRSARLRDERRRGTVAAVERGPPACCSAPRRT